MKTKQTKIFNALSDSNRLRILKILQQRELCVCEIREILDLANSTVSKHLSILKDNGFINERKDGKWVYYNINANPEDLRINEIISRLDFWISDPDMIINDTLKLKTVNKINICK